MQPKESTLALQTRFAHLTNHLIILGKTFTNDELNLKVLGSLTREWQPKVTSISEKKSIYTMTFASLFGKLQDHEMELEILQKHEIQVKDAKDVVLKIIVKFHDNNQEEDSTYDDDDLIRKFEKKIRKERKEEFIQKEEPTRKVACFKCGKRGHVKSECHTLKNKDKFKSNNHKRENRVYVKWDDNEISSSSNEEHANKALMASHHSSDEEHEVSDFEADDIPSYDELQSSFHELHDELLKISRKYSIQKKTIFKSRKQG